MATVKVVLNKDRIKKHGDYALVIQIIHQRVKRVIYTPYKLKEAEFDPIEQKAVYTDGVRYTHKKIKEINHFTEQKREEINKIIHLTTNLNKKFTVEDIIGKYHLDQSEKYLITFMERHIARKESQGKIGTARAFQSTLRSLKKYIGNRVIKFTDINYHFIKEYEDFLSNRKVKQNTMSFYLRNFRTIYNLAENSGVKMNDTNAFRKIKIKTTKTVKRALKQNIVKQVAFIDLADDANLDKARDLFMFSFYTRGMAFVDIIHLKHENIIDGVIYYRRQKTNQHMEIAITEPLQKLIDKYNIDDTYVLPFINEINHSTIYKRYLGAYGFFYRRLNRLQKKLKLTTPLTTYVARHSWATIAKEQGVSTSIISEGLGHTSEKTTLIYLKEFDRSVIDQVNENIVSFSSI